MYINERTQRDHAIIIYVLYMFPGDSAHAAATVVHPDVRMFFFLSLHEQMTIHRAICSIVYGLL